MFPLGSINKAHVSITVFMAVNYIHPDETNQLNYTHFFKGIQDCMVFNPLILNSGQTDVFFGSEYLRNILSMELDGITIKAL